MYRYRRAMARAEADMGVTPAGSPIPDPPYAAAASMGSAAIDDDDEEAQMLHGRVSILRPAPPKLPLLSPMPTVIILYALTYYSEQNDAIGYCLLALRKPVDTGDTTAVAWLLLLLACLEKDSQTEVPWLFDKQEADVCRAWHASVDQGILNAAGKPSAQ